MCAWLTMIESIRRASKGRLALSFRVSARWPWKRPASRRTRAPAASSRCIEPVTCPAAPQNVRRIGDVIWSAVAVRRSSARAEEAVARVAQAGQDVARRAELAIERGGEDRDVGVRVEHALHPFRRRDQAEEADAAGAGMLE